MSGNDRPESWKRIVREMITESAISAPTEPGVYRMPCGACVVDFFITAEGEERWLVAGDETSYTRETVAIARHGEHPWERLYTLSEAASEIARLAGAGDDDLNNVVARLASFIDDQEIIRIARARRDMDEAPLSDLADRFGSISTNYRNV